MLLSLALRGAMAILLAVVWEGARLFNGATWSWAVTGWRWALTAAALGIAAWMASRRRRWLASLALVLTLTVAACWWDLYRPDTRLAWIGATGLYATLLALESAFAAATRERDGRLARLEYGIGFLLLTIVGGATPVVLAQVESRFAEEEFFVAVQVAFLCLFTLLLLLAQVVTRRLKPTPSGVGASPLRHDIPVPGQAAMHRTPHSVGFARHTEPFKLRPLWGTLGLLLVGAGLVLGSARAYQASFYTPGYDYAYSGISSETPFLCASLAPSDAAPDGQQVFQRIVASVAANPHKGTPEFGMLALATGEQHWAGAFRQAILTEAEAAHFTEPANSVKYGQRLAALRIYYFPRVQAAFPDLFSAGELALLSDWFAAINRRALTVEWVDYLYGLAFSVWPTGPYENQENGAGLLALLESAGLGDSELSAANRDYLARDPRGWLKRFRNTDDAYLYQTEWIDNALFQAIYHGSGPDPATFERNRRLTFEWLLLQTLPDGAPLTYNRPGALSVANTLYLGALLLDDARYVWAADQALTALESAGGHLYAQPGLEQAAELTGVAPTQGSCLLFSPSGLPTQVGPLAPDKIVFRDGWEAGATYLLLNLRFTGWHRYKGANGIVLLYQDAPLVVEQSTGESFGWLPTGRSQFRDKRIPRENLNGLLIPRSGFSQAVYALSGLNGPWAQDPPHHARVEGFYRLEALDASRTTIENWRGWRQRRAIYFFNQGPVVIVDNARSSGGGGQAALSWHLAGLGEQTESGLWLRRGAAPVRVALPAAAWDDTTLKAHTSAQHSPAWDFTYLSPQSGRLDLVTAFLMNGWAEVDYKVQPIYSAGDLVGQYVHLRQEEREIRLLHNASSDVVAASGLSTDGAALIVTGDTVCTLDATQASLSLPVEPRSVRPTGSQQPWQRGAEWEWANGTLTLWPPSSNSLCVIVE